MNNPREAAYLALLGSLKQQSYVSDFLEEWRRSNAPPSADYHLAREIAYGSVRMALALDFLAEQLAERGKLKVKLKERALLRTALYQHYFLDKIPPYAIVNETIKLGKKYCHETFVKFLNALLRKVSEKEIQLPQSRSVKDLSIRYSYPEYYIEQLIHDFDLDQAIEILKAQNKPSPTFFRIRSDNTDLPEGAELLQGCSSKVARVNDPAVMEQIIHSSDYYIQNVTPAELIATLARVGSSPKTILDLCASPGGKLLAVHDQFPDAKLFANDVSHKKVKRLADNCKKYGLDVAITCGKGEEYPEDRKFDLIILDVPCSNSGVLNKRAEARWRISPEAMQEIQQLQKILIEKAVRLLNSSGEIWYMTCSILEQENNQIVQEACETFDLHIRKERTILPNKDGWDGGYACALQNITILSPEE